MRSSEQGGANHDDFRQEVCQETERGKLNDLKEAYIEATLESFGTAILHSFIALQKNISMRGDGIELPERSMQLGHPSAVWRLHLKLVVERSITTSHSAKDGGQSTPSCRKSIRQNARVPAESGQARGGAGSLVCARGKSSLPAQGGPVRGGAGSLVGARGKLSFPAGGGQARGGAGSLVGARGKLSVPAEDGQAAVREAS